MDPYEQATQQSATAYQFLYILTRCTNAYIFFVYDLLTEYRKHGGKQKRNNETNK